MSTKDCVKSPFWLQRTNIFRTMRYRSLLLYIHCRVVAALTKLTRGPSSVTLHVRRVLLVVDSHHEHRGISRGGRDNHLLGTTLKVKKKF